MSSAPTITPTPRSTSARGPLILREVTDIFRYWDVFTSLVLRDFKGRYRAKILGVLWSIGDPLVMMFVYTLVFTFMFPHKVYAYPVVLLLGMCPHRFFANGVTGSANSIVDYSPLVRRVAFPRHLLPPAVLSSHLIHFGIEIGLILVVSRFYPGSLKVSKALFYLPVIFAVQITYMSGMAFLMSSMNVLYRDVQYMLRSLMLVLYWLTPIFYPADFIPVHFRKAFMLNPMAGVVIGYRHVLLDSAAPDWHFLGVGALVSSLILVVGIKVFRKFEGTFADYV